MKKYRVTQNCLLNQPCSTVRMVRYRMHNGVAGLVCRYRFKIPGALELVHYGRLGLSIISTFRV